MAIHRNHPAAIATSPFIVAFLLFIHLRSTEAQIGVCYGMLGGNLPRAKDVVNLYRSNGIGSMRLYVPDQETLQYLQGTDIQLILDVPNDDIVSIASHQSTADDWVEANVVPYAKSIRYIAVGNEIHPSEEQASSVECAMQNIQNALNSNQKQSQIQSQIKVSTAIDTTLITNSYPPSNAVFSNLSYITPIINFLAAYDSPLLVNIQPYTSYISDMKHIKLEYALFTAPGTVVTDDKNGMEYQNLFDAIYDSVYVAIEKVTASPNTKNPLHEDNKRNSPKRSRVVASESGWPSKGHGFRSNKMRNSNRRMTRGCKDDPTQQKGCAAPSDGGEAATVENAKTYYTNLIQHVKKGTPLTQGQEIEAYLFAMFDENQKTGDETERHFGLFTADGHPKYGQLSF